MTSMLTIRTLDDLRALFERLSARTLSIIAPNEAMPRWTVAFDADGSESPPVTAHEPTLPSALYVAAANSGRRPASVAGASRSFPVFGVEPAQMSLTHLCELMRTLDAAITIYPIRGGGWDIRLAFDNTRVAHLRSDGPQGIVDALQAVAEARWPSSSPGEPTIVVATAWEDEDTQRMSALELPHPEPETT